MDEWFPVLALPNLNIREPIENDFVAIVDVKDPRMSKLRKEHAVVTTFVKKFRDQFGQRIDPAVLLVRYDAPNGCKTAEAVNGFRDLLSVSVIPYARARRLCRNRPDRLAFNTAFQFYPWMVSPAY